MIRSLREQTGAGIMDCKRALEQSDGDIVKAEEVLREQGIASAARLASRATNQGLVESYIHSGGRIGAMVEVNCETDFVARTPEFRDLAHNLAMQVAAMSPRYVDSADIPEGQESNAEEDWPDAATVYQGPDEIGPRLVGESVGRLGENVRVRRFARFSLGE